MYKIIASTTLITLTAFAPGLHFVRAGQPQEVVADQKAVLEVVQRFDTAWNRADAEAVAALFAPDGEFVSPSGAITSARAEIKNLLAGEFQDRLQGTTLTTKVDATKFIKQDAALAKGTFTLRGIDLFLGFETSVSGAFIFRIQKTEGRWMIEKGYILHN
jgi:uncharacterized protein (TIGR02246 family)